MRVKYIGICVLLCVVLMGCRPHEVLSNKEMRAVLYDLHRMDGALQTVGYNYGHDEEMAAYYKSVLDRHGVTQAQFDSSLVWFTDNPQIFNKIYPKVVQQLKADLEAEEVLRDERLRQIRVRRKGGGLQDEPEVQPTKIALRVLGEVEKEYVYGAENPWKEWRPEEFCEKNVIIFGQVGAGDALALSEP